MKKSSYVTKYDYINYYVKQPNTWFYTSSEIDAAYNTQLTLIKNKHKKNNDLIVDLEDDDSEVNDDCSYDLYKEYKENNELNHLSEDDPRLISGRLIDALSKLEIKHWAEKEYSTNFRIYDFDEQHINLEESYKKTVELLNGNEYLIVFQPTFINRDLMIATKCDAIIKYENQIILVETKGTSSSKLHHFLDLFFQKKILEGLIDLKTYTITYRMCLVRYERLSIQQKISFIVVDTINPKKYSQAISKYIKGDIEVIQRCKIGAEYVKNKKVVPNTFIDDLLEINNNLDKCANVKEDIKLLLLKVIYEFDITLANLWKHKKMMEENEDIALQPPKFIPHKNDRSKFKNTDMWMELRSLYALEGYNLFDYSGNVMEQSGEKIHHYYELFTNKSNIDWLEFLKGTYETKQNFYQLYFQNQSNVLISDKYEKLMKQIKERRVYFDFETINPAFRVLDNTLPFTQVVTQCSIVYDDGTHDYSKIYCQNLMIDPKNYKISFLEEIVDAIWHGSDCSYVVYNKAFEKSRLEEMTNYLSYEYRHKIEIIVKNLYDLADFFKVTKDSYCVFLKKLGGFYSIKKVLALIETEAPNIFLKTNCKNYKTLDIQNGLMCQNASLRRFFSIFVPKVMNDKEWDEIVEQSKKYCENDVWAMVAVYEFVKDIAQYLK